jgi:hypothetical protein
VAAGAARLVAWHLDRAATPALLYEQVTDDVRRAARLIDTGPRTFAAPL